MVVLYEPDNFAAVGCYYQHFPQVEDEEVLQLLEMARTHDPPHSKRSPPSHVPGPGQELDGGW